jgi:NAD+ synthase
MTNFAIAQLNPTVGDIAGNVEKIRAAYRKAAAQKADIVIFPELAITGYPPEDLILFPAFRKEAIRAAGALAKETAKGPAMIVGGVWEEKGKTYNAALLLDGGKIARVQTKTMLPNYGVFDEKRVFLAGKGPKVFTWRGKKLGIFVCEDTWSSEMHKAMAKQKPQMIISINASPFEAGKAAGRRKIVVAVAKAAKAPVAYVNMVGGQDDIVFDGGSFVIDAKGKMIAELPEFEEAISVIPALRGDLKQHDKKSIDILLGSRSPLKAGMTAEEQLWRAMQLGLRDYVHKNGFQKIVLGLSGGIDSALTAAVAVDALGAEHVKGVLLPSPYTSHESTEDALALAQNLGIETFTIPITEAMETFQERLNPVFHETGWMEDLAVGGNLQARLRGVLLMALSNKHGWLLLTTGNKSEIAVGYSTLYGDACGGYNVIKDLYKTQVYALAKWRNLSRRIIPSRSITKAPSAELKPGQKDQDQLPPYDVLDAILKLHIEQRKSAADIIAKGYKKAVVEKVVHMVRLSEYKRRQSAPGVKLSPMQFGKDRRYPLTNAYKDCT